MKIKIWGARGSIPAPGRDTVHFGGNTSCLDVGTDDGKLGQMERWAAERFPGARAAFEGLEISL
jgi:phosphoribosyl 1,2-cyclic phosphodiesterase